MSKEKCLKSLLCIICTIVLIIPLSSNFAGIAETVYNDDISTTRDDTSYRTISYENYISQYSDILSPDKTVFINGTDYVGYKGTTPERLDNYDGAEGKAIKTLDTGYVEWQFDIEEEGLYNIAVKYMAAEGTGSAIEREIWINDQLPFEGARGITFQRKWTDAGAVRIDNNGNEFRPDQAEIFSWEEFPVASSIGFEDAFLKFYFTEGTHTIKFVSVKEPVIIQHIKIYNKSELLTYEEFAKQYERNGYKYANNELATIKIQGQDAVFKSDPTLYPVADHTSPRTEPSSPSKIKLNTIGGWNWRYQNQYLTWEFVAPEDGLYKIAFRLKQDYKSGSFSSRRLYINDKVPFKEAESIKIKYDQKWQMIQLGGDEPYLFYFEEGKHEIKLEVVTGDLAEILKEVQESMLNLSYIYRNIRMLTGYFPDRYRDYRLEESLPNMIEIFKQEKQRMDYLSSMLADLSGGKGGESEIIDKLAVQLDIFIRDPGSIPERLDGFNGNISALGHWVLTASEQPLLIDTILVSPPGKELPRANAPWYKNVFFEIRKFISSFFTDYNYIGDFSNDGEVEEEERTVTLWLGAVQGASVGVGGGRDQANILKNLIDSFFTQETGIRVNLRLVDMNILLRAVATGNGPDLSIFEPQSQPVNYAFRNAAQDLMEFPDIEEVLQRFDSSALEPFRIGEKLFALPEQQWFNMMFYRKDILSDLGVEVPQTWDDLYSLIPVLQRNFLDIGLPTPVQSVAGGIGGPPNPMFVTLLYQNDTAIYNEDGSRCILNSNDAINSFIHWTELYTKHRVPQFMNELTRFRMGEAPIVIAPYTFYNQLIIGASEIRGLWGMAPIPGIIQENGVIRREQGSTVFGTVMYRNTEDKEATWEFMKWWTSAETQVMYGREIEGLQGPSARWPTANLEAMNRLPWASKDAESIAEQWKWIKGIPEVPGGYYTGRFIDNAIRSVLNEGKDPRDTMLDYVEIINDEIILKRQEFGLE